MRLQGLEAGAYRALTQLGTGDRGQQARVLDRSQVKFLVRWMDHRLDDGDLRVSGKGEEGASDDRLSADLPILFGKLSASPQPASTRYHDGCDFPGHIGSVRFKARIGITRAQRALQTALLTPLVPLKPKGDLLQCSTCARGIIG